MRHAQIRRPQFPPPEFSVRIAEHGTSVTIDLSGELDVAARPALEDAIDDAFTRGPRQVVLDLSRLTFMDSTGVHLAVKARGLASTNDAELILIPGPSAVQRVFAIAHTAHGSVDLPWAAMEDREVRVTDP